MATQRSGKQAVRHNRPSVPGWGLFVIGLAIGIVLMGFVAHRGLIPSLRRNDQPQANPHAVAEKSGASGIAASAAPSAASQFDFYKVLPEKEVVIPGTQLTAMAKAEQRQAAAANDPASASSSTSAAAPAGPSAATPQKTGGYVLQVGAFPHANDADAMKAKLALQGFAAHVQAVTLDGQVWNRVRVGPFASATRLQAVQKQLTAAGIHSIPLKEK